MTEYASDGSTLALKPKADVTRSLKKIEKLLRQNNKCLGLDERIICGQRYSWDLALFR